PAPSLPPLPIQYADFSVWQRGWLQGEVLERQLSYWSRQLAGATPLELPTDRPRPTVRAYRGGYLPVQLSKQVSESLEKLSQKQGVTLYMTLLASFQALLHRYSGQTDVVVGSPIANRNHSETEGLIGFFVNTLAMRGDLSADPRFDDYLQSVSETALEAYAHQDLPFEKLVEQLQLERDLSRNPIFQVLFALQNTPLKPLSMAGLEATPYPARSGAARFDLTAQLVEGPEGLQGSLIYDRELYDRSSLMRLAGHWQTLLEAIVRHPSRRVSRLPLQNPSQQHQMLVEWNQASRSISGKGLYEHFQEQAEKTPQSTALAFQELHLSYSDLAERAAQLACRLQGLGAGPETVVGICLERSPQMVSGLLGVLQAGAAYLPLDPDHPQQRREFMLEDAGVRLLITSPDLAYWFSDPQLQILFPFPDPCAGPRSPVSGFRADPLSPAYLLYTSGSTGQPKGAVISQRAICNHMLWMRDRFPLSPSDRVVQKTSFSFDASIWEFFAPLMQGAQLVLAPPQGQRDLALLTRLIRQEQVTVLQMVPSMLGAALDRPELADCTSLRLLFCGGEALSAGLRDQLAERLAHLRLVNLYGLTEAAIDSTWQECRPETTGNPLPIGRPVSSTQAYVLDRNRRPVPTGAAGELCVAGAGLARCYLVRPALTAEKFVPDPFGDEPGGRLYRSGDLARFLAAGNLQFLGRIDHQVKVRGFRIEPAEIEAALLQYPTVAEAAVVALPDPSGSNRLVAFSVAEEEAQLTSEELSGYLGEMLPSYMVPSLFVQLETLPRMPNGKLDRQSLPRPESVLGRGREFVAPRDPIEAKLAGIWKELLGIDQVGVHDDFFQLGGHSLLATQVISNIRKVFSLELPLRTIFEAPTVAGLAGRIERACPKAPLPAIVPSGRGGRIPLSFAQQRLWFLDRLVPDSPFYNIPVAWQLVGALNVAALRLSLSEVIRRHEILRTCLSSEEEPQQVISKSCDPRMAVVDLTGLEDSVRQLLLKRLSRAQAVHPFDLSIGPLFRATLVLLEAGDGNPEPGSVLPPSQQRTANSGQRTDPSPSQLPPDNCQLTTDPSASLSSCLLPPASCLLLTMHHVISDGWSMGILQRELTAFYSACVGLQPGTRNLEPGTLPPLPVQYADFAIWQRRWLQGEALDQQLSFWKKRLTGIAPLELPSDRPRPALQAFRGEYIPFQLPDGLLETFHSLSQQQGATLYMTMLAAFQTLLHRYTGQPDIVVGSPIAGRNHREIEGLIGLFVNTLAMRSDLSGDPSFTRVLKQVSESALEAYSHQDLPFEKLVEQLQPERNLSRNPIFQVLFALQNAPPSTLQMAGLTVSPMSVNSGTTRFDLEFYLWERTGQFTGLLAYDSDLFNQSRMLRLIQHFQTLLEGIAAHPAQRLS
ncbi:MAG: amino acid adenylation domain-containing protein, partial [Acidobacteriota bacterium]